MYNVKLKNLPLEDRPREKALKYGIEVLSTTELIALILGSGTKNYNVLEVASTIVQSIDNISDLSSLTLKDLCNFKGISKAKALQLQAAIKLGQKVCLNYEQNLTLSSYKSLEIYKRYKDKILVELQEKMIILFINQMGKVIAEKDISGTNVSLNITINLIKCWIFDINPKKMLLMHSHVEGNCNPSNEDIKSTIAIEKLCKEMGVLLLDHPIISKLDYFSFKDQKFLNN